MHDLIVKRKDREIESDKQKRKWIESKLERHVMKEYKNGIRDIGVCLIYFKNYPTRSNDDVHKQFLKIDYSHDGVLLQSSWIDNIGIYLQEHLWHTNLSVYVDKTGIFFIEFSGQSHPGFTEHRNKRLIFQLPFKEIINFDFKERIEHEPILYVSRDCENHKKLYGHNFTIREKPGDEYFCIKLDSRNWLN